MMPASSDAGGGHHGKIGKGRLGKGEGGASMESRFCLVRVSWACMREEPSVPKRDVSG